MRPTTLAGPRLQGFLLRAAHRCTAADGGIAMIYGPTTNGGIAPRAFALRGDAAWGVESPA